MFRAVIASVLLAILIGGGFTRLLIAVDSLRQSGDLARHSRDELGKADQVEKLIIDLETGQRGFVITRREQFLEPWTAARASFPREARRLIALAEHPDQKERARDIYDAGTAYIRDYSEPLVAAARRNDPKVRTAAATAEGKRQVDALRSLFDSFVASERGILAQRQNDDDSAARRAVAAATAGLAGSIVLVLLTGAYFVRAIVLPVRRVSTAAGRLARGDLTVRTPETGVGEIRVLEHAFNTMGGSLEKSHRDLRALADEQVALRRVATLVARGVAPAEVLEAVAVEAAGLLGADAARIARYELDGTATGMAGYAVPGIETYVGERFTPPSGTVVGEVRRTGHAVRMDLDDYDDAIASVQHAEGVGSSVGAPIVVEGRLWGLMTASWRTGHQPSPAADERMAQFTDLVATAIANADTRAELTASRARVVAAGDESRRRIERDLHDGAQQRLVHTVITLKLAQRALAKSDGDGDGAKLVEDALESAQRANVELRDLAQGILPSVLAGAGLRAAVGELVSTAPLPVSVDIPRERLPESVEATAYFIIAEALTNVVKHAGASTARVKATLTGDALTLEVRDDGSGGADIDAGSGLVGLRDRAAALNGELRIDSPRGGGTTLVVTLPTRAAGAPR
jgi:signal transduction histidine kinase